MRSIPSVQLVANPTSSRWSQAYTTLNLYVVVHMGGAEVATRGKNLLEQVLREYFALDIKNLESIKDAVSRVASTVDPSWDYSLTLVTIVDSVAYIVVASCGKVALLRGSQYGFVAQGSAREVLAFSGKLKGGDILIVGTCDFFEKVKSERLGALSAQDIHDISEALAPIIHTESTGGEAAVLVQFSDPDAISAESSGVDAGAQEVVEDVALEEQNARRIPISSFNLREYFEKVMLWIKGHRRQSLILGGIILLSVSLLFLLTRDRITSQKNEASSTIAAVQGEVSTLLEDAEAYSEVEPARAIQALRRAESIVLSEMEKFEEGSDEYSRLAALLSDIRSRLESLEGGESIALASFFEDEEYSSPIFSAYGDLIFVASGSKIALLSDSGGIEEEDEIDGEAERIFALENFLYVLTDNSVIRVDGGNLASEEVIDEGGVDVSAFGNNAYLLTGDDILRSSGGSYFEDSPLSEATSLTIDGSIYVFENGEIFKYLRGERADFSLEGLVTPFGEDAMLYTNTELEDLYVLDPANSRVVVLSKEGAYQTQYRSEELSAATSLAVVDKTAYVTNSDGVFTFEL